MTATSNFAFLNIPKTNIVRLITFNSANGAVRYEEGGSFLNQLGLLYYATEDDIIQQILITGQVNEYYNTPKVTVNLIDEKNDSTILGAGSENVNKDPDDFSSIHTILDFGFLKIVIPIFKDRIEIENAILPQQYYNIKLIPVGIGSTEYLYESRFTGLDKLTKTELRLRRNEIFARHGQSFNSDDLKEYFSDKIWYQEIPNHKVSDDELSDSELLMIDEIKILESK